MSRSLFVLNSERKTVIALQLRKAKDELRTYGLGLEGPYADRRGSILGISREVKHCMEDGTIRSPIAAAIAALTPQNMPGSQRSWLEVPFVVERVSSTDCDSAGAVACAKIIEAESGRYRAADLESLTMIGVAVLRRLGVPAFFAYHHFDPAHPKMVQLEKLAAILGLQDAAQTPMPSILVMEKTPVLCGFASPHMMSWPPAPWVAGLEILDDEALLALMRIKSAYLYVKSLMRDIASNRVESRDEGDLRAMAIGHLLHRGVVSWPLAEAEKSVADAKALIGSEQTITSMRHVAQTAVHNITCPLHHTMMANEIILSGDARKIARDAVMGALEGQVISMSRLAEMLSDQECFPKIIAYIALSQKMREHMHAQKDCPVKNTMS
ncbi:hypothetical protein H0O00_01875 [Candidatus Micrarchaeota archaeon]|nr:hypothetical protein [Candidatus Micrarchaeota archaeon]